MTYPLQIVSSLGLCALSAVAMRHDRASRFVTPYLLYGLATDAMEKWFISPMIGALRPAHGPMRGLGVWLVGVNQWQCVTDVWVLVIVIALAFHRWRIAAFGAVAGTAFFALAMGVYHWVRAGYPDRNFDSVLRVDATSEMLGGCAALVLLVSIIRDGLRTSQPVRLGVGHFVMLMYAAAEPTVSLMAYTAPTPNYDVRTAGLLITKAICLGAYVAAFAIERRSSNSHLFVSSI